MNTLSLKITDPQRHIQNPQNDNSVKSGRYSVSEKNKIAAAAKEFESLLTSMMLKSMNKTSNSFSDGKDSGFGGDIFNSIFQSEFASFISKQKSLGVADIIYQKLTGDKLNNNSDAPFLSPLKKIKKSNYLNGIPALSPGVNSINRLKKYNNIINEASKTFGVDKNLIKSVVLTESAAKSNALSSANAKGLMQLIDSTATDMGVRNVWDPKENIYGGTKYLSQLLRKYDGNVKLALAGYNAGPANVEKYNGVPPFDETKNYINRVMGYFNHLNG